MSSWLVRTGRLAWPLVMSVAFVTVAIVLFDLIWRLVTMSFESLALAFVVVLTVGAVVLFAVTRLQKARTRNV